jgi:hypothetical protein
MFRISRMVVVLLVAAMTSVLGWRGHAATQESALGDPSRLMQTVLERMTREPPAYRGDANARLKWEWWDGMTRSYLFEKHEMVEEVSVGQPNELRPEWVFRNIKVTFQDIYRMPDQSDDKLVPILSYYAMLQSAPSASFEGLKLYGKDAELKGTITRKYTVSTAEYPMTWANAGNLVRSHFHFVEALEYKDAKSGKIEIASGNASDAITLKWGDIKNNVADDMSDSMATEQRRNLRAAVAKSLKESIPDR